MVLPLAASLNAAEKGAVLEQTFRPWRSPFRYLTIPLGVLGIIRTSVGQMITGVRSKVEKFNAHYEPEPHFVHAVGHRDVQLDAVFAVGQHHIRCHFAAVKVHLQGRLVANVVFIFVQGECRIFQDDVIRPEALKSNTSI